MRKREKSGGKKKTHEEKKREREASRDSAWLTSRGTVAHVNRLKVVPGKIFASLIFFFVAFANDFFLLPSSKLFFFLLLSLLFMGYNTALSGRLNSGLEKRVEYGRRRPRVPDGKVLSTGESCFMNFFGLPSCASFPWLSLPFAMMHLLTGDELYC